MKIVLSLEEVRMMSIPESVRFLSFANSYGATIELDQEGLTIADYLEKTIVGIETDEEGKKIHYYGYGYFSDDSSEKTHRFLEYTWFIAPLEEVLKTGIAEYESENQDQFKQYITDCTEDECESFYEHYDNGKMPKLILAADVDMNTPDGVYILF